MEKIMEAVLSDASGAKRVFEGLRRESGDVVWLDAQTGRAIAAGGPDVAEAVCSALKLWRDQGLRFSSISWVSMPAPA